MSDTPATSAPGAKPGAVGPVSPEAFMELIVSTSRLLSNLSRVDPFKSFNLGLGEWAALATIRDTDNANNKQLARILGVTGQRVNQISDALKRNGLISIKQSPADSRMNAMSLTDQGRQRLNEINAQLTPLLAEGLKGSERAIVVTSKTIKRVTRVFQPAKTAETPGAAKQS